MSEQPAESGYEPAPEASTDEQTLPAVQDQETRAASFDEVLSGLLSDMSDESRVWLETLYEALPTDKKSLIAANLEALVKDVKPAVFYKIVHLALRQYEGVFDKERR